MTVRPVSRSLLGLLLVLVVGAGTSPAFAQTVTVRTSAQFSSGSYGFIDETDAFAWITGVSVATGRVEVGVRIPYVRQSTPWVSYTGAGATPSRGPRRGGDPIGGSGRRPLPIDTSTAQITGVGDPQLRVSLQALAPEGPGLRIDLTGYAKPPLTDPDAGIGTGAWDLGLGLTVARPLPPFFISGEIAYWWLGDLETLRLDNTLGYSIALGQIFDAWGVLVSLTGSTAAVEDVPAPVSTGAGIGYTSPAGWAFTTTAALGLTDGAPDWAVSLGGSYRFDP